MKNVRLRPVSPSEDQTFWKRADECWALAEQAQRSRQWYGCVINAIHSVIALADLMCSRFSGQRYAGTSHDEAVSYYSSLNPDDPDFNRSVMRLVQILSHKTQAEYTGEGFSESTVAQIMKQAERFRDYVLKKLPRPGR